MPAPGIGVFPKRIPLLTILRYLEGSNTSQNHAGRPTDVANLLFGIYGVHS